MRRERYLLAMLACIPACFESPAQRVYSPHSVLVTGGWYKISVDQPGVYKIDVPYLLSLGINTGNIPSAAIRLFGNGGEMLPEGNSSPRPDDLVENAIQVVDGGDGVLNGQDYILFYAPGPDVWKKDSANLRFTHIKNIYTDKTFYFLTIGGSGKRIGALPLVSPSPLRVTNFSERYFHELDAVNFLAGSKEWYGEELSSLPGRSLTKNFLMTIPGMVANTPVTFRASCVARSVGSASRFDIRINNIPVSQMVINAVPGGQYDRFAEPGNTIATISSSSSLLDVGFTYVPGSFNAQGWINWFELFTRRSISLNSTDQLLFRDWLSVGNPSTEFVVQQATASTQVWEITDPLNPAKMNGSFLSGELRFTNNSLQLREYIAFNPVNFPLPKAEGKVANQNLHDAAPTDYIIITYPMFLSEAHRLAELHRVKHGLQTKVVTTEQVFNEFSGGSPDPTAFRDFVKMYFDKFRTTSNNLRYLLLFGDASFDYKNRIANNSNFVPAYQNNFSLDPLSSYTSDDYFGFLDDHEDINSGLFVNLLDIGIGRVPAKNITEAKNFVDKVSDYLSPASFGPWRNNLAFIADDEDNNLHLQDAEVITGSVSVVAPVFNQHKIYLDAYRQETGAGGSRYPEAEQASNNLVYNGTLIWNYNGHGGPRRLAEETILDQQMVDSWNNRFRLPLFITATCDVAPFDNPTIASIGENMLLRPKTGAIALMTTTRVVFAFSNRIMNDNYLKIALQTDANGRYMSLGDAVKEAKNFTYQTSSDITNNRKFTLLGDPALTLGFPVNKVSISKVNGLPASSIDTLRAMEKVEMEGVVTDQQGNILTGFDGQVYLVLFDKVQTIQTLANDPGSISTPVQVQNNIVFKGKASVAHGRFIFSFRVPRDINFQFGQGRLSLYATNSVKDGNGLFSNFIIGGAGSSPGNDQEGPVIRAFLNDELFVNGGITNEHPVLIVKLADSSGINTTRTGIGHELVATLDNDNRQYFILNDYYQADLDSYQQGTVRFQLPGLTPGPHSLKIKAWDVLNNSSEAILDFTVAKDEELELSHVLNYPNPFTTSTSFWFEHNKPGQLLQVQVQIMSLTGRVIKTISRGLLSDGNRSVQIFWDGRDDFGDRSGRGVYFYRLRVISPEKKKKEVIEKLVIL